MKTYLFSYNHNGARWGFEIIADSPEDAIDRVKKLSAWSVYDGELIATIPGELGWFVKLVTRLRNLWKA